MSYKSIVLVMSALTLSGAPVVAAPAPVIAIDVGHSKSKPGAISARGTPEFAFNLALAQAIQKQLLTDGMEGRLVGEAGNTHTLAERGNAAHRLGATFLVSVHHDSAQKNHFKTWQWRGTSQRYADGFSGFSLFVSRKNPNSQKSLLCASHIGQELIQKGFHPSSHHAIDEPGENRQWGDQKNGVYFFDDLIVLKAAPMPAVLFEAGVIVNRHEESSLRKHQTRKVIAKAVASALSRCRF